MKKKNYYEEKIITFWIINQVVRILTIFSDKFLREEKKGNFFGHSFAFFKLANEIGIYYLAFNLSPV